ncbi:hypothetical protein GGR58DRAFT_466166 [Xylaria digitata]|nr:hypothetical protein GGR58DRAFT_466166 [Xylaria digitata]
MTRTSRISSLLCLQLVFISHVTGTMQTLNDRKFLKKPDSPRQQHTQVLAHPFIGQFFSHLSWSVCRSKRRAFANFLRQICPFLTTMLPFPFREKN